MLPALSGVFERSPQDRAGVRLRDAGALRTLLARDGVVGRLAADKIGSGAQPVRAILFDKSPRSNWALGWHQDRTICVRERHEVEGFGPWTVKDGLFHVAPPFALLERMVTIRVHLDAAGPDNAPLLIAPGSHRLGLIRENQIAGALRGCGQATCLADPGDVWVYATPILHASARALAPMRRRVLQVDYSADPLPSGLAWLSL